MSLVINRATARVADAFNRAGLSGVNRAVKAALWRLAGNRLTVAVDGLRISGPAESWTVLSQLRAGTFEPFERRLFVDELMPGMVVLDVGANIGCYTLLAARRVAPSGHVYAFEPDPRTRASLEHNVRANALTNVTIVPKAAADAAGRRTLYMDRVAGHSGLSNWGDERSIVSTTSIETVRIDLVLSGQPVDLVKLDIEGHEAAALRGMEETLARSPDIRLFVEFFPEALEAAGTNPAWFRSLLIDRFGDVNVIDELTTSIRPFSRSEDLRPCNLYCRGLRR